VAVAAVAFFTGWIASRYGLRPYPFYIGVVLSLLGFFGSWLLVKDTKNHVAAEVTISKVPRLKNIFWDTTLHNRNLSAVTQAGLVNNLNDGMAWGILPILLASKGFNMEAIGIVTAIYPAVWGIGQLFTGKMADHFCKKDLLFLGMLLQGIALVVLLFAQTLSHFIILSSFLGIGTALVYPTFLATVADNTHPTDRAKSMGVFRLWRDSGYAIGAILTGIIADTFGIHASVLTIGVITIFSAGVIWFRMNCGSNYSVKLFGWLQFDKKKYNIPKILFIKVANLSKAGNLSTLKSEPLIQQIN
jgi:MFS family permease